VAAAVRGLGLFVSQSKLASELIPSMIDHDEEALTAPASLGAASDGSGGEPRISKEAFVRACTQAMREQLYRPDNADTLLCAFRTLDTEGNGWIELNLVKEMLARGEEGSFTGKESTAFAQSKIVRTSTSSSTGVEQFFYEDYVRGLTAEVERNAGASAE